MCLAVPGQVTEVTPATPDEPLRMGVVDFEGVRSRVCLDWLPEVGVGDWVIVHAGFAIQQLDQAAAAETLAALHTLREPET